MGSDLIHNQGETPHVLKDMQAYLGNPQTMKELYDSLMGLPREDFYDLHPEEELEAYKIFRKISELPDRENDYGKMYHDISNMFRLKHNIEKIAATLCKALEEYPVEDYFYNEEKEKYDIFQYQVKSVFKNAMQFLEKYKKQISIEGVYTLQERNEGVVRRLELLKEITCSEVAAIVTYILQNHIYTGDDSTEKGLNHLMDIHGEDISRPLLGGDTIPGGYTWDSLLFMRYGFGQIDIDELIEGIKSVIARNNERINQLIEPFIPLYNYLRTVLEKTNATQEKNDQIVPLGDKTDIEEIRREIDIKEISKVEHENDCLKILVNTDKNILEAKLAPLKEICKIQEEQKNLLSE